MHRDPSALEELLERLGRLTEALESSQREASAGWADLSSLETESAFGASVTRLDAPPMSYNPFLVEYVVAVIPATTVGLLTIGRVVIPMAAAVFAAPMKLLLAYVDQRSLTCQVAGSCSLVLMGRQLSDRSLLR